MPDREKVIKGLEHCSEDGCKDCPYETDCIMADGFSELAKDVLELLKIQETARAIREFSDDFSYDGGSWWYECGNCQNPVDYHDVFCSYCGKRLVWDAGQGESDKPLANHTNMGSCRP